MPSPQIHLTKEKETLLATLYARAKESRSANPILRDEMAEEAVRKIDYDFEHLKADVLSIAMRAKLFDNWTNEFIAQYPNATVLHLGCGLDSRVYRINPPPTVRWFDVDYPEVVELRRQLYPEREGYQMIGSSLAELRWVETVPADNPAWILLEGVSMYLTPEVMNGLLARLTKHFPNGAVAFDAIAPAAIGMANRNKSIQATGATFGGFAINEPEELKTVAPKLQFVKETRTPELPGYAKLPVGMRALVRVFDAIPSLRKLSRIVMYRF